MVTIGSQDDIPEHTSHQRSSSHSPGSRCFRQNEKITKKEQQHEAKQTSIGIQSSKEATDNEREQLV